MLRTIKIIFVLLGVLVYGAFFQAAPAQAACVSPAGVAADIVYNTDIKVFQYCDGTNWIKMSQSTGSGSGDCTNPDIPEGQLAYRADLRAMSGCAGGQHVAMGAAGGVLGWTQVSANATGICGILSGNAYCWGYNAFGQVGDNSIVNRTAPTLVSGGSVWKLVSAGDTHTCGVKSDDTLWCWGSNSNGQIGDNTSGTNRLVPTTVSGGSAWKLVSAGNTHTCGIKSDDTLWCWGNNANGKTGLNTSAGNTLTPTQVNGGGSWKFVSAGSSHSCGIKSDDTLWCWGNNFAGKLGDSTSTQRLVPTAVSGGLTWRSVSAGGMHTCGIRLSNNALYCWGNNWNGGVQTGFLGDGTTTSRNTPTAVSGGGSWISVSANFGYTCGVKADNSVWCWGDNKDANLSLGYASYSDTLVPTATIGLGSASAVVDGCILKTDGLIRCWGPNDYGKAGNGAAGSIANPFVFVEEGPWKSFSGGINSMNGGTACAIKTDDSLWCWGFSEDGSTGIGPTTEFSIPVPTAVAGGGAWKKVSTNASVSCGIKANDTLWCWGDFGVEYAPVQVGVDLWRDIDIGYYSTCAIKLDGSLWCGSSWSLSSVNGGGVWLQVDTGTSSSCAVKSDNTLWCWGDNYAGQLGDGSYTDSPNTPVQVSGGGSWKKVSVGNDYACAVKLDGSLWCWGYNDRGQLGDASTTDKNVPTPVSGGGEWIDVGTAFDENFWSSQTCAVKSDKSLWCWGMNQQGQVGDGTTTNRNVPTSVLGGGQWVAVSFPYRLSCALSTSGEIGCWGTSGENEFGNLDYASYHQDSVSPQCGSPTGSAGTLVYNADINAMQYCDGVGWVRIGK
ncbi:MAG: hypothetical protein NDJ24_06155 [Alphaproteobacteria bacterium]|nr:hypothetical protein [Alphaproteobacteria bacterium]